MNHQEKRIVLVGLDFFDERLLGRITRNWPTTLVDRNGELLKRTSAMAPGVKSVHGDVTSRLTWMETDLESVQYVISTIRRPKANREMMRMLRDVLHSRVPVMLMIYRSEEREEYTDLDVELVSPFELGIQYILRRIDKDFFRAAHIGLGAGELVEIRIRAHSHLVGRRLRCIRPSQWRIAALYREERLILPTGNCRLKVGDRVVLVGDPQVLESVANLLMRGTPQFPLQYGKYIVCPMEKGLSGYLDEVLHWHAFSLSVKVQLIPIRHQVEKSVVERVRRETGDFDVGPVHDNFSGAMKETKDMGMLVVDRGRKFSRRLRHAYQECPRPMLIPGGKFPYTGVLISLNGPDPALALESGAEVARQMDAPFQVLYVALPRELRGRDEARALELRQGLVSDFPL